MKRFFLIFLFVLFGPSCGSDTDSDNVETDPRFTLEIAAPFTVVSDGINSGTILISNRGESELNFDFSDSAAFELKRDESLATNIAIKSQREELVLPPGESQNIQISLEGTRADTGAFELSLFAMEVDSKDAPITATINFEALFDPEEISPVQARRCNQDTLSQQKENELDVLYGLDGHFCFNLKRSDTAIKNISAKIQTSSPNLPDIEAVNEKYSDLSFSNMEEHRIEIPFSFFVTSPEEKITLSIEIEGEETQTYTIAPRPVFNSLWLTFAELQSVPELEAIQDQLAEVPDTAFKKFTNAIINLFLYRRDRTDADDVSDNQKSRVATAQTLLSEIKNDESDIDQDIFLIIRGLADSYTASIKKADGGGDFIESSVKHFKESVTLSPNDWVLRFIRGIIILDMGRGIKDDFLGNLVYGDDADGWIIAGKEDLKIVIDAHAFASIETLDWSIYNQIQQPVPNAISTEASAVLKND